MRVRDFLHDAPAEWLDLPAEMELAFTLLPGHGVNQALFNEYTVDSMEAAVAHVFSRSGDCIFFHYRLLTRDVIPLFGWYVSRSIQSRGRKGGAFAPREAVEPAAPGVFEADRTLMEIYCKPLSSCRSVRMLRVGGRARKDALAMWHRCVEPIRKLAPL